MLMCVKKSNFLCTILYFVPCSSIYTANLPTGNLHCAERPISKENYIFTPSLGVNYLSHILLVKLFSAAALPIAWFLLHSCFLPYVSLKRTYAHKSSRFGGLRCRSLRLCSVLFSVSGLAVVCAVSSWRICALALRSIPPPSVSTAYSLFGLTSRTAPFSVHLFVAWCCTRTRCPSASGGSDRLVAS